MLVFKPTFGSHLPLRCMPSCALKGRCPVRMVGWSPAARRARLCSCDVTKGKPAVEGIDEGGGRGERRCVG